MEPTAAGSSGLRRAIGPRLLTVFVSLALIAHTLTGDASVVLRVGLLLLAGAALLAVTRLSLR